MPNCLTYSLKKMPNQSYDLQLKLKDMEIQAEIHLKELELKVLAARSVSPARDKFDVSRQIRLVPPFKVKEVECYFLHFEKVAKSLKWPDEVWTLLLQSVFVW